MNVREFLTRWNFEVDTKKLDNVESQLQSIKNRLDLIAGVELVRALYQLGERFAQFGIDLKIAAESAGLTVEEFQRLTFAANQSSISTGELETSMKFLSRRLYDARMGSQEAAQAFALAGFSTNQVQGFKTAEQALLALSDRMNQIHDPIQKTALGVELMGRGSLHMVGFLSQGSGAIRAQMGEADKYRVVLTKFQVETLAKLEQSLQKVWAVLKALSATIASDIAPVLSYFIKDFLEFFNLQRDIIGLNIEDFFHKLAFGLGFVWGLIKGGTILVEKLADAFGFKNKILDIVFVIWALATAITGVGIAAQVLSFIMGGLNKVVAVADFVWGILSTEIAIIEAPLWAVIAAIAVIGVVLYGAYKILSAFFRIMREEHPGFAKFVDSVSSFVSALFDLQGLSKKFSFGAQLFSSAVTPVAQAIAGPAPVAQGSQVSVTAPMTFTNVPVGTSPEDMTKVVKSSFSEYLDTVQRQVDRATQSNVAR